MFGRSYRKYTANNVKSAIKTAIDYMTTYSYYGPLIERFPIKVDDEMIQDAIDSIEANNSCACADSNNVFISTKLMADMINADIDYKGAEYNCDLRDNVITIIAHEYSHILARHSDIGVRLAAKYNNKPPKVVWYAHLYACEVEANRGHCVDSSTAVYACGITEDDYPDVKKLKYYPELFEWFLKQNKDIQQKLMKMLEKVAKDMEANDQMNSDGNGGTSGDKNDKDKNGEKDKSNNERGESLKDKSARDTGSKNSNDTSKNDKGKDKGDDEDDDWEELTKEQLQKAIDNASESCHDIQGNSERGLGLEDSTVPFKVELTQKERLEKEYDRWEEKRVKNEFKKMKGLIKGVTSKNREHTYARPTRRPIDGSSNLIKKGVRYEKSYSPKVLIAMDSSGSMCSTTMKEVACAIENIFKDLGKPKDGCYICKHESDVSDIRPMREWKTVVESYYPCGGNDFVKVAKAANKLGVDVVLNIGDGQDVLNRGNNMNETCRQFVGNGRKWFDVLVTSKGDNQYYKRESEYDRNVGFNREPIYLGNELKKYLK